MTLTVSAVRADLRHKHDVQGLSWRQIRELYFPTVPAGTLCSVAKGDPIPHRHRQALTGQGRREMLPGERKTALKIGRMAKQTKKDVLNHENKGD